MTKIATTPELMGTFISSEDATSKLADLSVTGIEVKTVENTGDTINLALPYYANLEKSAGKVLSDSDLAGASGGAGDIAGNNAACDAACNAKQREQMKALIMGMANLYNDIFEDVNKIF